MDEVNGDVYSFGSFEVNVPERTLTRNNEIVELNNRAFDLLLFFVSNSGRLLTKDELLETVWKGQYVEESNLTVQVSALRRMLRDRKGPDSLIQTVTGRGYRFLPLVSKVTVPKDLDQIPREGIEPVSIIRNADTSPERHAGAGEQTKSLPLAINWSGRNLFLLGAAIVCVILFGVAGKYILRSSSDLNPISARKTIKRLTTDGNVQLAVISPDGSLFSYVTNNLGERTLWLGYTAGGNHVQLQSPRIINYSRLVFSPDNSQLYYSTQNDDNSVKAVYRSPVFGGVQEKVMDGIDDFILSPDGERIAFGRAGRDGRDNLIILELRTKSETIVSSFDKDRSFKFNTISWSPDGARLALSGNPFSETDHRELVLVTVSDGSLERIKLPNLSEVNQTFWLKSGDAVIVTASPGQSQSSVVNFQIGLVDLPKGTYHEITSDLSTYNSIISATNDSGTLLTVEHRQVNNIWVSAADDLSKAKQITFGAFGKNDGLSGLDWTPDGRIVFSNSSTDSQVISVMNTDGSGVRELSAPGYADNAPMVSNDSKFIVFQSNRTGIFEIWRMSIDGNDLRQLTFGGPNVHPCISLDDRFVYFSSRSEEKNHLRRVPVEGGELQTVSDTPTDWCGFSSDGKYFATSQDTDPRVITVFSSATNEIVKQIDVTKSAILNTFLRWTPDDKAIVYRDIWGLWAQSINGGEPKKIDGLPKEKLYTYAWSKDGRLFAFVRGSEIRDVVLIKIFR